MAEPIVPLGLGHVVCPWGKTEARHMAVRDLFDLTGKAAVVTGGSRGLGKEMVLAFAEQGADVVIADDGSRITEMNRRALAHLR